MKKGSRLGVVADLDGSVLETLLAPRDAVVHEMMPRRVVYARSTHPAARLVPVAIQKGTRVLISLWDSLMFGRVPGAGRGFLLWTGRRSMAITAANVRPEIVPAHTTRSPNRRFSRQVSCSCRRRVDHSRSNPIGKFNSWYSRFPDCHSSRVCENWYYKQSCTVFLHMQKEDGLGTK